VVVLTAGVLLIVSFVASAFLATAQRVLERTMALPLSPVLEWTAQLVTMTGVTLLIVVVYRFLPSVRMSWPSIWVGAISTTFFFFLGRSAIAAYVSWSGVGSAFGATGSLVALMLWIYYTSLSLFLGAEVAQVWAKRSGKPIVPRFRSEPGAAVRDVPRQADAPKPRESSHPGP
jgi:membrane protein